jgi:TolA-binding protein
MGPEGEIAPESPLGEGKAPEPQPAAPAEGNRAQLLSNDDLDALIANLNASEPDGNAPSQASQAIEKAKSEAAQPKSESAEGAKPSKSQLLSNEDLEALLAEANQPSPPKPEPSTAGTASQLLSNDDIEALLAEANAPAPTAEEAPAGDETVAAPAPETPAEKASQLLSNDDIEALLASIGGTPAVSEPAADKASQLLSNDDLEALMASAKAPPPAPESPVVVEEEAAPAAEASPLLSNDDIEALLAGMNSSDADVESEEEQSAAVEEESEPLQAPQEILGNDDVESLISELNDAPEEVEEEESPPVSEGIAVESAAEPEEPAAVPEPAPDASEAASQDLIESLIRGARNRGPEGEAAEAEESKEAAPAEALQPLSDEPELEQKPKRHHGRLAASLALGFFAGACLYLFLMTHPYRSVEPEQMKALRVQLPEQSYAVAKGLAEGGRFSEARRELQSILAALPPGKLRTDAEYLDVEAAYHLLPDEAKLTALKELRKRVEGLLAKAPDHPKGADALCWKADLLKRSDMPEAAYAVYKEILTRTDNGKGFDKILLDAADSAMKAKLPNEALELLRRLMQAYPASPLRGEGEFLLGEAYLDAGDVEAGKMTLMSVARAHPDSELGAEAFAKLGGLSYDAGDYDEAIRLFESRLQTATKVAGNDTIYLMLARAHRAKKDLAQAEHVLRELIDFFPDSKQLPSAMVELSQVLEGLGRRDEAVKIAKQAAQQFSHNPEVLSNAGRFLAETGEVAAGADTLVAAEHAGAENPAVLLEAARQYRSAKDLEKAAEVYQRILDDYSTTQEAAAAGIELARVDYEKGRIRKALERLEDNAAHMKGHPGYAEALDALGSLYNELGLSDKAAGVFRELAGQTTDSVKLARAASTLFEAGQNNDAMAVAGRIDPSEVPESLAYSLLMRQGSALTQTNAEQAVALMEQAYQAYPNERRPEDVQRLLDAYLALDRTAAARALVVDAETRAKENPAEIPTLEAAAARWGDYLYGRGDYTGGLEAYGLAGNAAGAEAKANSSENRLWSRFQQANCLLQQGDLPKSLPLYEEVANAKSPWSDAAAAKAQYVKLELRRRGIAPQAPLPAPTQPAKEG